MGIVGCYTLHMYCDHPECSEKNEFGRGFGEISGTNYRQCMKHARACGWTFPRVAKPNPDDVCGSDIAYCPRHKPSSGRGER
jgi:hypothetical protein